MSEQIRRISPWWGLGLVLFGAGLVLCGYLFEGTWEDVAIQVGAAAGVGGVVLLFKPRLMRQVKQVATEAAAEHTEPLERRVSNLENINKIQATEIRRQRSETERIATSIGEAITFANVEALLMHAYHQGFFDERVLVKTNTELGKPLLEISPFSVNREDQFESPVHQVFFRVFGQVSSLRNHVQLGPIEQGIAVWNDGEDLQRVIGRIIGIYKRSRLPEEELDPRLVFSHLIDSFRLMSGSLLDPRPEARRPTGKLVFYINDEWALTDIGLESTKSEITFTPKRNQYVEWVAIDLADTLCPPDCHDDQWNEARAYMDSMKTIITDIADRSGWP